MSHSATRHTRRGPGFRVRRWTNVHAVLLVVTLLALDSWFTHLERLERQLGLEATELVQVADTLAWERWHKSYGDGQNTNVGGGKDLREALADRRGYARELAARTRPGIGQQRLRGPDGSLLMTQGRHSGPGRWAMLGAADEPGAGRSAWMEAHRRSALSGVTAVTGVGLGDVLWLWGRGVVLPGGTLLGASLLLVMVAGRLRSVRGELQQAQRHSLQDALTGLPNRRAFDAAFLTACRTSARERSALSVVFLDIDHFKRLNDDHGHITGDRALRMVGAAIRACLLRPTDFCCRWGGEEFVVLLPDTGPDGALETAERILERVRGLRLRLADHHQQSLTVSAGIASHPRGPGAPDGQLVMHADHAMLEAKHSGRDRWVVWCEEKAGALAATSARPAEGLRDGQAPPA